MSKHIVFISYSHKDEKWKDCLVSHLGVLQQEGILDSWDDRRISAGQDWEPEIEDALNKASVAILLISANFLNSKFILTKEVPALLQRRAKEGLPVIPVIVSSCTWQKVSWLKPIQSRPKDGKPLAAFAGDKRNRELAKIADEISNLLARKTSSSSSAKAVTLAPDKISIAHLPITGPDLFNREQELQLLDYVWTNPDTNVIAFVAWGGVGKSALVNHWLARLAKDRYRGAERVYGWSFYSQGANDRVTSADLFFNQALRWFGDPDPTQGSPWDKGERLARLIRVSRTLLVLDGLEPLQHPPGPQEGRLKDQALQACLRELAAQQPGLCVISTREKVGDLAEFENSTVLQHELEHLSPQTGAQILRAQGVRGEEAELETASAEFGGHSLALTLLGSYLADVYDGDIRRRNEIESLEEDVRRGGHARRVMAAYEKWLGEGVGLAVLRMLGLFDRPADPAVIAALRASPAIPDLTEALQNLKEREWQQTLAKLRRVRLLAAKSANNPDVLDAHPLVREHFREQLKCERPDAWRAGNNRLYEYLTRTAKEFPETVDEMSPLFVAVEHGCEAGRHQEVLVEVYVRRIQRGEQFFSTKNLGTFGANLSALASFFVVPWQQLVSGIPEDAGLTVFTHLGYPLRALGRLKEATGPMQVSLEWYISQEDWVNAAFNARSLNSLYLTIGDLLQAQDFAHQSVTLADRSGDWYVQVNTKSKLAAVIHQTGQLTKAAAVFREAEAIQKTHKPDFPFLYSMSGFRYCDLLLDQGNYQEVNERAARTLEWSRMHHFGLLPDARDNLSLGRACLLQVQHEGASDFAQAGEFLQRAVEGLRKSGRLDHLPSGLLAHVGLHRIKGDFHRAQIDLGEALRIATRGEMGLYQADCHLEAARLALAQGDKETARAKWEQAKGMIAQMGYHRRDPEVAEIAQVLGFV